MLFFIVTIIYKKYLILNWKLRGLLEYMIR